MLPSWDTRAFRLRVAVSWRAAVTHASLQVVNGPRLDRQAIRVSLSMEAKSPRQRAGWDNCSLIEARGNAHSIPPDPVLTLHASRLGQQHGRPSCQTARGS